MRRARLCLRPGQPGTKSLLAQYGKSLVCVRYRYDERTKQRTKTVELIVEEADWRPGARPASGETVVSLRVGWQEHERRQHLKAAGGKWDPMGACVETEPRMCGEAGIGEPGRW